MCTYKNILKMSKNSSKIFNKLLGIPYYTWMLKPYPNHLHICMKYTEKKLPKKLF